MEFRYLENVVTLELDGDRCTGCGMCTQVCVQAVLALNDGVAYIVDRDGCMECGACAMNCPVAALMVRPGVGCAWAVFTDWFKKKNVSSQEGSENIRS
ncbi:MAG: 4Fe-4S binding protein [Deltaproteobacteria bacterium]|nr:MAG: 4Fe-4S binding protein [Deltaproteobacteria bacterium]